MKTRIPLIAVIASLALPGAAFAQEPEIDEALLVQLKCQLLEECGEPVVESVPTLDEGPLVVAARSSAAAGRSASPFPSYADLQKMKKGKTTVAAVTSAPSTRPTRDVQRVAKRELAAPVVGQGRRATGAVEAAEAVAKRANLFVTFRLGSAELEPSAIKSIDTTAKLIKEAQPGKLKKLRIAGHTDATGDVEVNTKLSADRAAAVRQALIDRGVSADMLEAEGFGSSQPIDGYAPTHGINRRVEAVVIE